MSNDVRLEKERVKKVAEEARAIIEQAREARSRGQVVEALEAYERVVAIARTADEPMWLAHALRHIADIRRELGDCYTAQQAAREAVAIYREQDSDCALDLANALRLLALAQESLGKVQEAGGPWREARALYEAGGVAEGVTECDVHIKSHEIE